MQDTRALEKASVLVAEDDPDTRAFLRCWLEGEGLDVLTAEDGAEALALLARSRPDLILTDLARPEVDGLELIQQVKRRAEFAAIPIVAMTSYRGRHHSDALSAGAAAVLRKPDDFDQLVGTIHQALLDSNLNTDARSPHSLAMSSSAHHYVAGAN
jgi:CheY-like chemotaxis protein